jgi:lipopolysaccharide export system protein LptA
MSNDVAKLIIKDLLSGDSAKDVLTITQSQLNLTEQKVILKDSVINKLEEKVVNCELIVDTERKKYTILEDHTKKVEVQLKKEKIKNKFQKIVSGGIVVVLSYLLITK